MPNDGVRLIVDRKLWETILREASLGKPVAYGSYHAVTGSISHVARLFIAAQHHLSADDALMLALIVQEIDATPTHRIFIFPGLELL